MDEGLHSMIGRLALVQAPLPTPAAESPPATPPALAPYAAGEGTREPGATADVASAQVVAQVPLALPRAAAPMMATPPTPLPTGPARGELTEEEQAILGAFRLVGRSLNRATLTPVERAFVEAGHVVFDRLADLCKDLLQRSVPDHLERRSKSSGPPRSAKAPRPSKPKSPPGPPKGPGPKGGTLA